MSESTDRILELLDNALETTTELDYGSESFDSGGCVRSGCGQPAGDNSDFCDACRSFMLGDVDVDPIRQPPADTIRPGRHDTRIGYRITLCVYEPERGRGKAWLVTPWRAFRIDSFEITEETDCAEVYALGSLDPVARIPFLSERQLLLREPGHPWTEFTVADGTMIVIESRPVNTGREGRFTRTKLVVNVSSIEHQRILGLEPRPPFPIRTHSGVQGFEPGVFVIDEQPQWLWANRPWANRARAVERLNDETDTNRQP